MQCSGHDRHAGADLFAWAPAQVLEGKKDASDLKYGRALVGTGCPILGHQKPAAGAADAAPK
eukprot:1452960-Rhodomonas_salina.1